MLLVAAYRFMAAPSNTLAWAPLLTNDWQNPELTDVSILVARLFFWHHVLLQPVVTLRELLGSVDAGVHEMSFCVPNNRFSVCEVRSQLTPSELQSVVSNMDAEWAFQGPHNSGPNSWLLLHRSDDAASGSQPVKNVVAVCNQSRKRQAALSMQFVKLREEAEKMLHIPDVNNLMVHVTDERRPGHPQAPVYLAPTSEVVVSKDCLPAYYSACICLLNRV